ncbi:alpha/beta hydrolase-fold protein [Nesterenkonia massiliensis]|uniref:Alpha/beta hydrolase-fold protein n=1 Tax=Nesterenkonia massiliensis TaxID=1232429 RepID=A0ABT2HT02_9MICC|nr:alpha/beta hydrolase-fold protein [Nesterenkonia massiliensis]MCT1607815.1 alpha/beta hydrolase-fold protein [Nesterenkonia massiliensis]
MGGSYEVIWTRDESERRGTPLLVLLHGYGANAQDLMGLVPGLPAEFTVAAVQAPVPMGYGSYTWFELDVERLAYSSQAARQAVEDLWEWLAEVKEQHSSVTLLGFSMGMAMATSLLRTRPDQFAAVVGLSGFAVDPERGEGLEGYFDDDALAAQQVPFFWGRDQQDPVIPAEQIDYTHSWATGTVKLTKVLYAGAGHGIVPQEVSHINEFLKMTVLRRG